MSDSWPPVFVPANSFVTNTSHTQDWKKKAAPSVSAALDEAFGEKD